MKPEECAIVSVGEVGNYILGIDRLNASLDATGFTGRRLFWRGCRPRGSPAFEQLPYALLVWAMMDASRSARYILRIDPWLWAIKPVDYYFDCIKRDGHVLVESGWKIGQYCKDAALAPLGIGREWAMLAEEVTTCIVGLDVEHPRSRKFLDEWFRLANDGVTFSGHRHMVGSSDPRVRGHRFDQTAASVLAHRLGMTWLKGDDRRFVYYNGDASNVREDTILLMQGI